MSYELTPALPAGVTVDLSTRQVSGKPTAVATAATYTWRAKDSDSNTADTDTVALTFSLTVGKGTLATPENLVLKDGTRNKTGFTVTWDAVDNAVGYTATAAVGDATVTGTVDTSGSTPEASFSSLAVGTTYTVKVIATGDTNYNDSAAKTLSQSTAANVAPSITGIGNQAVTYGAAALSLDVGATDSNGEDELKYQVSSSNTAVATVSPIALTALDATSKVTVTSVGAGTATITVTVNDGTASPTTTFTVTVSRATLATPVLTLDGGDGELTPQWAAVDNAASYELQWKAATTSSWDAATGVTTVGAATSGTALTGLSNGTEYNVRVRAKAASASTTYEDSAWSPTATETPVEDDVAPAFAQGETITTQSWKVGTVVDLTLPEATGGNGTVSYELTPALPAGVTVDLSTRQVSGKPTAVATAATYTWRAKDSDSNTADTDTVALTFSLTVGKGTLATPENLVLKDGTRSKTGFTVTWDAVDNAVGYTATAAAVGDATVTGTVDTSGSTPEASFSSLTVGTTYTVTVIATGDTNYNNSAAKTLSQSTAANAAPSITGIGNQAVTYGAAALSLDVGATDSNEEDDLKYQVSSSDTAVATVSPTELTALDATSKVTVTPVGAGTATITVTVNDGTASPTTTFTVTVSRATLATPVLTLDGGDGELTPQWAAVDNAASYELQWKAATTSSWDAATGVTTVGAATSGTALTGLSNGTEYNVRVRAKAASASTTYEDSAWSPTATETPVEDDVAPAFAQGETITTQSWKVGTVVDLTLPEATGGNGTVSYELTPALPAGVTVDLSTRQVSGKPTAVAAAATYTWRAKDSDSNTADTDTVALTFSLTVGKGTLATPENLVLKDGTRNKTGFTVTWDAVDNAVGYTATAAAVGDATVTGTVDTSGAAPEASFSGLTVGTTYTVTVIATGDTNYNNSAAKTLSQSTAANAAPSITGIGNQAVTYGAAALSLDVGATDSNEEDDLKYQVSSSDTAVATVSPTELTALDATSKVTVTPVGAGTATITVTVNDGTASPTTTFTVTVSRATLATPVLTLDGGDGELTPQWAAVDNAASYELQWKAATTSSWDAATGVTTVGAATSGTALTGLSNGTEYDVRVRAKAASASTTYEDSAWSQVKQATPVEDDVAPAFAQGETITTQSWKVGTVVDLTLPAATGGNGTVSYELTPALPAGVTVDLSTRQVSGKPTAVAAAATYTWRAKDSDSNTADTDTVALTFSLTVGKGTLATPENLVLKDGTRNKTGFTVTWDAVDNAVGYTATAAAVGDATVTGTVDTSGAAPEASFSGLTVGTTYTVKVIATGDTNYNNSAAKTLSQSTAANAAPSITGIGNQAVTYGAAALSLDVGATDSNEEDDLKYQVSSSDTAVATVSPTELTALDATSKVTVTPVGAGTATITLTVNDAAATGGNGTVSYELTPALPAGVTVDLSTRQVSGKPTAVATAATYTWRAKDSDSNTADTDTVALTFSLTVGKGTLATPENLVLKDGTRNKTGFTVTWDAVDNAVGYTATAAVGDATVTGTVDTSGSTPEASFSSLAVGTTYTVKVIATGDTNYNDSAAKTLSQSTAANVAPSITGIGNQAVTYGAAALSLDVGATDSNGEDELKYQVSSSNTAVATVSPIALTALDATSKVTVTSVGAGTATITVTVNDGTASPTTTFTVTVSRATLATPVLTLDGGDGELTPQWAAVDNAASYELQWKAATTSSWDAATGVTTVGAATSGTALTGLSNGTEYNVRVRAKAASASTTYEDSAWSPTATETPVEDDVAPAFAQGETITTQSWKVGTVVDLTLPAATGGNGTVSYELTPALPAGVTVDLSTRQVSGKPTAVATAATYTWRAKDSDSNTADTDTVALTFSLTVGKGTLATPENLVLKDGTRSKTGFTVTWDAVDNAVGYTATAAAVGDATVTGTVDTSGSTPEASFSSLTVGTTYTVTVIATGDTNYNNSAAKTLSQSTAANAAPSITGIGNQAVTYGAAALSLDVGATDSNEEDDLKYQVSSSDTAVATVSPTELTALDATSKVTVTPVGAGTATITVTVNDGTASPTTTFTVTVSRATLATPVLTLDGGDGELTPQWAAVANAASYELQWKAATTSSWDAATGVTTVGAATSGTALTGLSNGTEYNVRVRAKAASASTTYEDSAWSPTATETPVEDDVAPAFAQGETITTQSWKVGTVVDLTLPEATGGNGTVSYELTPALPAGVTVDLSTRQVSGKPTAVAAAATYTWRAKDSDSNTADTDTVALTFSLTVGKGTLATPENLVLKDGTRSKTGFTVTWDAVDNAVGYTATAAAVGDATVTGTVDTSGSTPEASFSSLTVGTTYTVTVIATGDTNYNNSAAKTLSQSTAANAAPSITGIGNQAVTYGAAALSLDVGATDSNEEDDLKYQVSSSDTAVATVSPTELTALDATSKVTVTPVGAGTATITVTVNDGTASPTTTFTVTVSRATLATPVLTLDGGDGELTPQWAAVDNAASYELQWKAATTSSWDAATGVTTVGAATSGTALTGLSNGTEYDVRVRAKAASASTTYEDSAWSQVKQATPVEDDVAPAFAQGETITTQSWKVGTVVDLTLPAATGGNGTVSYELTPALPAGVTVDLSTRQVSGKPTAVATAATYTWRAKDSDSNTADTDTVALTFSLTVGKGTLATPENLVLKDGTRNKTGFTVTWDAVDNAVGYTATAAVGDATVTGTVDTSGSTPEASFSSLAVGTTYTVTVIATGDTNYNDSAAKTLSQPTVANVAPSITGIGNQAVTYGAAALSLDVGATDSNEEDELQYQVSSSNTAVATVSPTALTALDATSKVTVTPVGAGTATITVTVNDGTASPTTTFTVTVSRATLATPVLTLDGGDGELTPQWAAVDNAASYELQWKAATTSSWDAATGVTTVGAATSGTALTGLSNGTEYDVRVRAKAASASTTYEDSAWSQVKQATPVEGDVAPAFAQGETITTQSWTVGTVVDLTLPAATGGNGTVSYELTPALPAGVTVDLSTRQVSGKPTAVATAATYTWRAKDSDSNTADTDTVALTFSLTVGKGTLATPDNLVLKDTTRSKTGFTVTWDAVDNAVGYTATAAAVGDATVTGTVDTSGSTPEASFSSLTVGTTYTVTVIATGDTNYNDSAAKTMQQSTASNPTLSITAEETTAVSVGQDSTTFDESVGTVGFTVTLSAASTETVTVGYATQGIPDGDPIIDGNNATSAVAGEDYTAATGTLTFTPGDTSKSITVNILDDTVFEQASEMFKLVLSNPAGALIASNEGEVLLIINNDDQNPAITVTAPGLVSTGSPGATASDPEGRLSVVEGDSGTTDVTLTITHAMVVGWIDSFVATIKRTSNLGSATAGSDFTDFNTQPIIIEAGETETTFTLSITGDEADEDDKTFYLTIRRAPQAGIITNSNAEDFLLEVTIVDDDGMPSAPAAPVLEARNAALAVSWTAPADNGGSAITDYDLRYREKPASGDPAWTELDDTTASTATTATITGLTSGTEYEVQVRAQNAIGEGPWSPTATGMPALTLSITAEETTAVSVGQDSTTFDESVGTVDFTVTLSAASTETVTVGYATQGIPDGDPIIDGNNATSAVAGEDYTAATGTLTFTPGDTSKSITVNILDDTVFEQASEMFKLVLSNPAGALIASNEGEVLLIINNDDQNPAITVTAPGLVSTGSPGATASDPEGRLSVVEGDSGTTDVTLTITHAMVVGWIDSLVATIKRTSNLGSATAGSDFTDFNIQPIIIEAGETETTFTLSITGDEADEADEAFYLTIRRAPQAGIITNSNAEDFLLEVTIVDDDGIPSAPAAPTLTGSAGQLTANWTPPSEDGSSAITDYDLRYREKPASGDPAWTELDDTTASTATAATITGLTNGTEYEVQVRAQNANGEGPWSPTATETPVQVDVAPAFADGASIPAQTWTVGASVDVTLPAATSGNGAVSYELTPELPTGVTLDRSTLKLGGAPTAAANGATTYTWRATDSDGNTANTDTAALTFTVTVSPAPTLRYPSAPTRLTVGTTITPLAATTTRLTAPVTYAVTPDLPAGLTLSITTGEISGTPTTTNPDAVTVTVTASADDGETATADITFPPVAALPLVEEVREEVNTEVLPSVINQVAEKQVSNITGRLEVISSGLNIGNLSMEEVVTDVADYLFSHHQDIQANGFDWQQALSGHSFSFALADSSALQDNMDDNKPSSGPVSFWGSLDYSSFQDKIDLNGDTDLDGDTLSFSFGVDKEFTSDLVAGVLLSIANSEFKFTEGFTGTYEVSISTMNPYISWDASDNLNLWASFGYGQGHTDLKDTSTNETVGQSGDFTRFSAGGRFQLWESEAGTGLALKLDGTAAHFLGSDVQRTRLATELYHDFSMDSGVLNTALELGLLVSSADESVGELVGRLHWQDGTGLSTSVQSRVLLGGGDRKEWGIGGALRYTTGGGDGQGEGLVVSLEPLWNLHLTLWQRLECPDGRPIRTLSTALPQRRTRPWGLSPAPLPKLGLT